MLLMSTSILHVLLLQQNMMPNCPLEHVQNKLSSRARCPERINENGRDARRICADIIQKIVEACGRFRGRWIWCRMRVQWFFIAVILISKRTTRTVYSTWKKYLCYPMYHKGTALNLECHPPSGLTTVAVRFSVYSYCYEWSFQNWLHSNINHQ